MKTATLSRFSDHIGSGTTSFLVYVLLFLIPAHVFSQESVIYAEGFENSNGGYTKIIEPLDPAFMGNDGDGLWEWGTPSWISAHSGSNCWGTNFSGNMPISTSSIVSPAISLASVTADQYARVSFWAQTDIGMVGRGRFYVSSDGSNFTKLAEFFMTMSGGWNRYEMDVSNYRGGNIYLKFYITDDGGARGFYIDDVAITSFNMTGSTKTLTLEANESSEGSCPWIYPWNGTSYEADNDIYSTARFANGEYRDYYALQKPLVAAEGKYKLQINEVASDESFTDYVELKTVDHAADVKIATDNFGNIFAYKPAGLIPPVSAISNSGADVLGMVNQDDGLGFDAYSTDYVDVDFGNPDISAGGRLVLKVKGFNQGIGAARPFIGPPAVVVQSEIGGVWTEVGRFQPRFQWAECAFDLNTFSIDPANGIKLRLYAISHGVKYHIIDYVAVETGPEPEKSVTTAPFSNAIFEGNSVVDQLNVADNQYAHLLPGNHMNIEFDEPAQSLAVRSFVFISEGYYIPRGNTFFIYTWNGSEWVNHDAYTFPTSDETKTFDLSLFLPDPDNEMKVRIWQDYSESYAAAIDYVNMQVDATTGTLATATDVRDGEDVKSYVASSDNSYFSLSGGFGFTGARDRWSEYSWAGFTLNGVPVCSDLYVSGTTMGWAYSDPESDPQQQASVQVWTASGGTGTLLWSPATFTGSSTSVSYTGEPLVYGNTYYLRVKVFDGNNWSQWSEYQFTGDTPTPPGVTTAPISSVKETSAKSGGTVTSHPSYPVTARGVCWNTTGNPTLADDHTEDSMGTGSFESNITNLTLGVTYYVRAYAVNSLGTSYGAERSFTTVIPTVCTPSSSAYPCVFMWISNVSTSGGIENFNNSSSCSSSYDDYSSTASVSQAAGSSVTLNFSSEGYPLNYVVWIDFDDDLTFSSTEKVVELYNGDYSASASFTVPAGAPDGTHRMRVRGEYYGWEIPSDPCSALEYGETEDYSFIVGSGATADPTSVSAVSSSLCPGSSTELTANGAVGTVYWYTGSCGGTLIGTGNPLTVTPAETTTYYARNYDNSTFSVNCAEVTITVNALPVPTITGTTTVCEGTTGVTYTTEAGMSSYTWNISAGGAITAGLMTNQITVNWNTAGPQTVSVN